MNPSDLAIVVTGLTSLASTGALVYTVRRVSPWPKPPAVPQPRAVPAAAEPPAGGAK